LVNLGTVYKHAPNTEHMFVPQSANRVALSGQGGPI